MCPKEWISYRCRSIRCYPNPFVEVPIFTHLPGGGAGTDDALTRNHINILSSDFVVLLPGGPGTALEAALARAYRKPSCQLRLPSELEHLTDTLKRHFATWRPQLR